MSKKRVYTQKDLVSIFSTDRKEVRFFMYEKKIEIKSQYCPFLKRIKTGYLINIENLDKYADEIALKKEDYHRSYMIIKNKTSSLMFFSEIGENLILNNTENYEPVIFLETNYKNIELLFVRLVDNWGYISLNEAISALNKFDINFVVIK